MPKITLRFESSWGTKEYEAEGGYDIYLLLEDLLHRLTVKKEGEDD